MNLVRKITILLCLSTSFISLSAQTVVTPKTFADNPDLAGGIYHTYHFKPSHQPSAPKGYKPFYLSMVSRHASRWHTSPYRYVLLKEQLSLAKNENRLTELGLRVQQIMDRTAKRAEGRDAEISPIGVKEQEGIAERMFESFPMLFKGKKAYVENYSSDAQRCVLTMSAFDLRLRQLNPRLELTQCANATVQPYLKEQPGSKSIQKAAKALTLPRIGKVVDDIADDVINRIYKPGQCPFMDNADKKADFVRTLSDLSIIHQDYEYDRLDDIFTAEEKFRLWEQVNTYRYVQYGASYMFGDAVLGDGMMIIRALLEDAREKISGARRTATLRFGHDFTVLSLLEAMKVDGRCVRTDDLDNLKDVWVDFDHAPMSTNIQFVFYRNKAEDIIVKIMHNERIVTIPLDSDIAPFYRWSELEKYMQRCADEISSYPAVKALNLDAPRPMKSQAFGILYSKYGK